MKSGLAVPKVRSSRWKMMNSSTMIPVQRIVRDAKSAATKSRLER